MFALTSSVRAPFRPCMLKRLLPLLPLLSAVLMTACASAPAPRNLVVFVNVSVVPMDSERLLRDQTVIVDDGRIAALGPAQVPGRRAGRDHGLPLLRYGHAHG